MSKSESRYEKIREIMHSVNGRLLQVFEIPDPNNELIGKSRVEAWGVGAGVVMVQVWPKREDSEIDQDSIEIYVQPRDQNTWEETAGLLKHIQERTNYHVKV